MASAVDEVRRFNRFYTRTIGTLQEHLLQSDFSLTEVRVLYELAHRHRPTAAELVRDLGLDAGYLSRILGRFEKLRLIAKSASPSDLRSALLSLTAEGEQVFAPLDRRSSDEVAALLGKLAPAGEARLLEAMRTIESLRGVERPRRGEIALRQHQPGDLGWVVQRHGELYWREWRYDERFEALVAGIVAGFVAKLDPRRERCWIAERDGERLGCVFLVAGGARTAKLRLLLVEPHARGAGLGRRLVEACIAFAHEAGYRRIVLWTQNELAAARAIYQRAGFHRVAEEPHDSWGRQGLVAETWELRLPAPGIPAAT